MEKPGCTVEKIGNILFVYDPAIPDDQSGNIYRQITVPLKFLGKRESEKLFTQNSFINKYAPSGGTGFIDVRDVVKILMKLIDDKTYNQKFVLISENKTYKDVLNLVAQKRNYSVKSISNSTLKTIKILSNFNRIFGGQYMTKANYYSLTNFVKYDNSKVKNLLNYTFIPITEAIDYHFERFQKLNSTK